ncbi:MAG: chloride channel protein [Planctomycetaceae bacterium]|nr:chloride channel protein [Planctomycetaceae bacterium]
MPYAPHNRMTGHSKFTAKLYEKFDFGSTGRLVICSACVGFFSSLAAVFMLLVVQTLEKEVADVYAYAGIHWVSPGTDPSHRQTMEQPSRESKRLANPFIAPDSSKDSFFDLYEFPRYGVIILLIPALGGLICGMLVWCFAPEAEGEGTEHLIKSYHYRNGMMRFRSVPTKILATLSTLGSGGSAGVEGSLVMIGGGIGSLVARNLKINAQERRTLLMAGAAGAIASLFHSPFGGALFAAEILYCSTAVEFSLLFPCIIASLVGYATSGLFSIKFLQIDLPQSFTFFHVGDFLWLLPFAFACVLVGWFYVKVLRGIQNRFFARIEIPEIFKPALGGLLLGCIALFLSPVRGSGYDYFQAIFDGAFSLNLLLCLIFFKILATSFTVSSGGSGSLIAPSLLIGGMFGYAFGLIAQSVCLGVGLPGLAPSPAVFMLLGTGALLGSLGKIPLTATVLVCNAIGSYELLIPILVVNLLQLAVHSPRTMLFREQLIAKEESPVHLGDFSTDLLSRIHIQDLSLNKTKPVVVPENTSLADLMQFLAGSTASIFPVADEAGNLHGFLFASDIRSAFQSHGLYKRMTAADLVLRQEIFLTPKDNLLTALQTMIRFSTEEIPIVASYDKKEILFLLRKENIFHAYHTRLANCQ